MSKSKLWRFKTFLIIAMLVLVAVAATPASVVYFSDSFKQVEKPQTETIVNKLFAVPNLISKSFDRLNDLHGVQLAAFGKAKILGKF